MITLIRSYLKSIKELPHSIQKVDIIISDWMGFCLFNDSKLESVIYARDRWLKPGGLILPDRASFYFAAIENRAYKEIRKEYWRNVYGFNMNHVRAFALSDPQLHPVPAENVVSNVFCLKKLDLNTIKLEDLSFTTSFELIFNRSDIVHGFVAFFDVEFSRCHKNIVLSTGKKNLKIQLEKLEFNFECF